MRRVELNIEEVKRSTESLVDSSGGGISDEEILFALNSAQYQLYNSIVQRTPDILLTDSTIDLVANQESYDLPDDLHLGSSIKTVWYKYGSGDGDYYLVPQIPVKDRRSDLVGGSAAYYLRQGSQLKLIPIPSASLEAGLRLTYQKRVRRLDVRRGVISSISKTGNVLDTITIDLTPDLGKDGGTVAAARNMLNKADKICIVKKNGDSVLNGIPIDSYDSSTGILTIGTDDDGASYSTTKTGPDFIDNYIVVGDYSTTHCDFPDETVERYLVVYAILKCLRRQGNPDEVQNITRELAVIEQNILDSYENPDQDLKHLQPDFPWANFPLSQGGNSLSLPSGGSGSSSSLSSSITVENVGLEGQGLFKEKDSNVLKFFNIFGTSPIVSSLDILEDAVEISIDLNLLTTRTTINSGDFIPFHSISLGADEKITWSNFVAGISDITTLSGVLTVPHGGTGLATLPAHRILLGEGTSTLASVATGSSGQILTSQGASSDPIWTTATYPATAAQGDLLYGSATNVVSSLVKSATATRYIANTGSSNSPAWDQINLTNGVTGTLPVTNGGMGAATFTAHGLLVGEGTSAVVALGAGTAGQVPVSGGASADPAYVTPTAGTGLSVTANATTLQYSLSTPVSTTNGGTGVSNPTAHSILVAEGASAMTALGVATNGQLIIGSTGADPALAVPTNGTGISWTTGAGTLRADCVTGGIAWTTVVGTSQAMAVNNGYVANNAGLVTLTLPASAAVGDLMIVMGRGAGFYKIAQNSGQTVRFGGSSTTTGVGGSLTATKQYQSITLRCLITDTDFEVVSSTETFTIV